MTTSDNFSPGDPGPNQSLVNRKQGEVNEKQGDHNDAVNDALGHRQDRAEALSASTTERRDAEHEAQAVTNAQAGRDDANRTEQFDAQAVTNAAAVDADAQRTVEFDAQAVTNRQAGRDDAQRTEQFNAQKVINDTAIKALEEVGKAAKRVTDLLEQSANRTRKWTARLAIVVLVIAVLAGLGYWQLHTLAQQGKDARVHIAAQADQNKAQAQALKVQARADCVRQGERDRRYRAEMTFLVDTAIGPNNKSAALRKFKDSYPAHLAKTIPPVVCAP